MEGTGKITVERVNELLDRAVAEKGADYIYTSPSGARAGSAPGVACFNWTSGDDRPITDDGVQPSCIAGHVYWYLWKDGDDRFRPEIVGEGSVLSADSNVGRHDGRSDGIFETRARALIREVQSAQDAGETWAEAVRVGREVNAYEFPA